MKGAPLLPAARREFLEEVERYEAEVAGLGAEFIVEVERAAERIAVLPRHGSPYLAGTRRVVLRRFPYSVVYRLERGDGALIVAIAHHSRRPGY